MKKFIKKANNDISDVIVATVTDGIDEWEEELPVYEEDLEGLTLVDFDWCFKDAIQGSPTLEELNKLANDIEDLGQDEFYAFETYLAEVESDIGRAFEVANNYEFSIYDDCYNIADFGGEYWTRNVDDLGIQIPDIIDDALSYCMDWEKFGKYIESYIDSTEIGVYPCFTKSNMYIEFF